MKKVIFTVLIVFAILCFFSTAYADTTIHLKIATPKNIIYDQNITVAPCDSDNNVATAATATPYCALLKLQPGIPSDWSWNSTYNSYYLNSLNNISGSTTKDTSGNNVYNFWDWFQNGTEAATGLSEYVLQPNDVIFLSFLDPGNTLPDNATASGPLTNNAEAMAEASLSTPTPTPTQNIAPTLVQPTKPTFDIKKAYDFLIEQQKDDGSWGSDLYTDWTALALASGNNQTQVLKLVKYLSATKIESSNLTDYERHAMALMVLGLNPYDTNGENYIEKITNAFDGKQFGDTNRDNDDIFALIVLQNAGYTQNDKIIADDISFILGAQNTNGSWDNSVDMTGAAVEALAGLSHPLPTLSYSPFAGGEGLQNALTKAKNFLKQNQKDDGSWNDNASSTAWALEGILALNEKPEDWVKNGNNPFDYLATMQDTDGGVKDESLTNKIWETAYVVSTLSGKTWNQIMQNFEKPTTPTVTIATPVIAQAPQKIVKKQALTASVINAVTPTPTTNTTETPTPKENWFRRLLDNIFGN